MGQENGHAFRQSGAEPALLANDTTYGCMARVDELLSQYNELVEQQRTYGTITSLLGESSGFMSYC
jgi:hypothetical protein